MEGIVWLARAPYRLEPRYTWHLPAFSLKQGSISSMKGAWRPGLTRQDGGTIVRLWFVTTHWNNGSNSSVFVSQSLSIIRSPYLDRFLQVMQNPDDFSSYLLAKTIAVLFCFLLRVGSCRVSGDLALDRAKWCSHSCTNDRFVCLTRIEKTNPSTHPSHWSGVLK